MEVRDVTLSSYLMSEVGRSSRRLCDCVTVSRVCVSPVNILGVAILIQFDNELIFVCDEVDTVDHSLDEMK